MKQRMPGVVIGVVGVVLIAAAIAVRLFTVAPAFERMTDAFRPEMESAQLAQLRADVGGLSAAQSEFTNKVVPRVATALKMTPQELSAQLAEQFPAVSAGMQQVPAVTTQFTGVLNTLETEQGRFERADAIPTTSLPATTVPWGLAAAGLACVAVGVVASRRRGGALALGLGLALVIAPLLMTLPGKADAADTMNSHLKPIYTAELVDGGMQALAGMQAMGAELQAKLVPALGTMLEMPPAQLQAYLEANFPTVTAAIGSMPAALNRFERLVGAFDRSLDDYDAVKGTELVPIVALLIAGGILVTGMGGWLLIHGAAGAAAGRRVRVGFGERLSTLARHGRLSH